MQTFVTEEALRRRLARLKSALESEKARLRKVWAAVPLGELGMRRTKCTPSFRREEGRTDWENQGGETAPVSQMCPQAVTITRFKETGR